MENYLYEQELYHHGVKGMKWGVRKVRGHAGPGRYITRKRQLAGDKRDLKYLENGGHLSVGLTKKRQAAYDKKDKDRLEKRIAKNEQILADRDTAKAAKKERKQAIKSTHAEINKQASTRDKLVYNDATRKKAAKYVVDKNMSMEEATKKAKGDALRNTAAFVAVYGGITAATLYNMNK